MTEKTKTDYPLRPRKGIRPPFGYKADPDNPGFWTPIPHELEALEMAKEYLKGSTYRAVAEWLTAVTGRRISAPGLNQLINRDRRRHLSRAGKIGAAARAEKLRRAQDEAGITGDEAEA